MEIGQKILALLPLHKTIVFPGPPVPPERPTIHLISTTAKPVNETSVAIILVMSPQVDGIEGHYELSYSSGIG